MLSYDRIKESFVRALESGGLVSLDPGRHKQLEELVDAHTEAVRKFLTEEKPEVIAAAPTADPAASANEAAEWLKDIELPKDWAFRQLPTTAHGAGRSIFAHYDVATGSPVAGVAHLHLITPDKSIVDIKFKPEDGIGVLVQLIHFAVDEYRSAESNVSQPSTSGELLACPDCGRTDQHLKTSCNPSGDTFTLVITANADQTVADADKAITVQSVGGMLVDPTSGVDPSVAISDSSTLTADAGSSPTLTSEVDHAAG